MTEPVEFEGTAYAVRLSRIMERWLVWVGVFIGMTILTTLISIVGFFLVIRTQSGIDQTKAQVCAGFDDVVAAALTPLSPPPNATPEQLSSYANANVQKAARIRAIERELSDHSDCHVSVTQP